MRRAPARVRADISRQAAGSLLRAQAPSFVADAFLATRFSRAGGRGYGPGLAGADTRAIVDWFDLVIDSHEEGVELVRSSLGEGNYARLEELRRRFDPDDLLVRPE